MKKSVPVIVLGCHKIGLGIIRALGIENIPVIGVYYSRMDMGYASRYISKHYLCPHPDNYPEEFIDFLTNKLSKKFSGSVMIPSDDATLIPVSRNKNILEKHYKTAVCEWSITEKYIDKKFTYQLAEKIGVPAPKTFLPQSLDEALLDTESTGFPCLLKPTVSHSFFEKFRKKMLFIRNKEELCGIYNTMEQSGSEMMLQEFIPGDDKSGVNYNSYFMDGKPVLEFTAQKMRLSPIKTGFPRVVVSKNIPEIFEPGRKILHALGYEGFSCTEFKKDQRNGIYKLMEINGRQNLSTPLAVKSGINFPYVTYKHLVDGKFPDVKNSFNEGVYWIDPGKDIIESIRSFRIEKYPFKEYLMPYFNPNVFTIPSWKDPFPLIKRIFDILISLPKFLLKKMNKPIKENK
jgi:D-aspartate ligase